LIRETPQGIQTAPSWHSQVQDDDVRLMGPDGIDRGVRINATGSDEKVRLSLEQVSKPLQNNRMVVGDDNLDRHPLLRTGLP